MRKTKFWILGIILALVYSCSDDFETVERSPQEIEVSEARAYFEKHATDLAPLTFKDPLSRSTSFVVPELIPEWDKAIESENEDYLITEVPLRSQSKAICVERVIKDAEFLCEKKIVCQRRLVVARQKDSEETDMFIATLVPDEDVSSNANDSFTGRVFYSELNGDFRKAVGYKEEQIVNTCQIGKAYGFAIYTTKEDPTGFSKLTFQEESTLRSSTYSSSEGGGGGWEPGWGGGGGGTGGGSIGGGGTGSGGLIGGGSGGYDPDYELGLAAREKIRTDIVNQDVQMVQVKPNVNGGYSVLDGIALAINVYDIAPSCFNFLDDMTQKQLSAFGNTLGAVGCILSAWQTILAFSDGEITGNDVVGAVGTALSCVGVAFGLIGVFPVAAGVLGLAGCVIGIVSSMINMTQRALLIQVPLKNGHHVYVYISPKMQLFA